MLIFLDFRPCALELPVRFFVADSILFLAELAVFEILPDSTRSLFVRLPPFEWVRGPSNPSELSSLNSPF